MRNINRGSILMLRCWKWNVSTAGTDRGVQSRCTATVKSANWREVHLF